MTTEKWLPVVGHNGYEVSDYGRVRSFRQFNRQGAILKTSTHKHGYPQVVLQPSEPGGKARARLIPHLVLEAFGGPRPEGAWCLHQDDDPMNNRIDNLRWGTPRQNRKDAVDNRGGRHWPNQNTNKTHCKRGHLIDGVRESGARYCKTCLNEQSREWALGQRKAKNPKLTDEQIAAIRVDPRSNRAVAEDYGVSHTTIRRVRRP